MSERPDRFLDSSLGQLLADSQSVAHRMGMDEGGLACSQEHVKGLEVFT